MNPVKIFIGSSFNGEDTDAEKAYEYSLRKHCDNIEIIWMRQSDDPSSPYYGWNTKNWATPFTAFRWGIPHFCGYEGKAIFTDVDMLNLRDISELFNEDMEDKAIKARYHNRFKRYEFSVMVMDCEKLKDILPPIDVIKQTEGIHKQLTNMLSKPEYVSLMDIRWNCLDGEGLPKEDIWQLHFTNRDTQPWHPSWYKGSSKEHERPDLVSLWQEYKNNALL